MRFNSKFLRQSLSSVSALVLASLTFAGSTQADDLLWTGGADADWNNANNWNDIFPPGTDDDVIINGAGVAPVIDTITGNAHDLTLGDSTGAGILTIQNAGDLQVSGNVVIGGSSGTNRGLLVVTSDSSFLSVDGSLTIQDSGNGNSILRLDNGAEVSVTGVTTVEDGTILELTGSGTSTLTGTGALVLDGLLSLDKASGNATVDKILAGSGAVVTSMSGGGTADLVGDNSAFTGTYQVNLGTLLAATPNSLGGENGLASAVVNGGTLDLNDDSTRFLSLSGTGGVVDMGSANLLIEQAGDTEYAGVIQGTGVFGKAGAGTLTLSGANTFSFGVLVTEGALELQDGSALADTVHVIVDSGGTLLVTDSETIKGAEVWGTVTVADGEVLNVDALSLEGGTLQDGIISAATGFALESGTVSSNLSGTGMAIKTTSGTVTLSGNNSYHGGTTIFDGALIVDGSLGGNVIANGGTLGGSGELGMVTLNNGSTLAPGNSIGTMKVINATFNAGSTYEVELNDGGFVAGTNNDLVTAIGHVDINGGTVHVTPENGTDDGITYGLGDYTIITTVGGVTGTFDTLTDDYAFLNFALDYSDANAVVLNSSLAVDSFCLAGMTENQCATGDGAFSLGLGNDAFNALLPLGNAEAAGALDQLSGEIHASAKTALVEDSRFAREATLDRLQNAMGGAGASAGQATQETPEGTTLWAQGFGAWSRWDGDGNAAEMSRNIGGLFMGGDAEIADNITLGLMGGYSRSRVSVSDRMSFATVDNYTLGAYAGGNWDTFSLKGGLAHSWHSLDTSRTVDFTGFSNSLSASYNARTFQAYAEAAYSIEAGNARFEPFANLAYVHLNTDGFTETGGAAALTAASQSSNATFTTLGIRGETTVALGETNTMLSGGLGWRHAFSNAPISTHSFASGGDAFTVAGVPLSRDALVLDAGFEVNISDNATFGLSYNGQLGSGVSDHGAKVGFQARF